MNTIFDALFRAVADVFQLRVFWIIVWPMLLSMLIWLVLGITLWTTISGLITSLLSMIGVLNWFSGIEPAWLANGVQVVLHLMFFIPAVFTTALIITAVFAMPALIRLVETKYYAPLKRESGGTILGNVSNAVYALLIYLAIWLATIPLWLIGLGVLVPFIAASYLNQRLFRYDALTEHASKEEMRQLFKQYKWSWWSLAILTGLLQFIPFLNLLAPVVTALAFIHFGLSKLKLLRSENEQLMTDRVNLPQ